MRMPLFKLQITEYVIKHKGKLKATVKAAALH